MSEDLRREDFEARYPWDLLPYNKIARFFSGLKQTKIETTRCNSCGMTQWPPRSICSNCLSLDLEWIELPKEGTIVAFSHAHVGTIRGEISPIIVAALNLDGGLRLLTRIINAKFEDLKIGMRVKLARTALIDGRPYWAFEPNP